MASKKSAKRAARVSKSTKHACATSATHSEGSDKSQAATRTGDWKKPFLEVLRVRGIIKDACIAANVDRSTAYRHKESESDFAALWQDALDEAADELEREAWRRAVDGTDKPIVHRGVVTGTFKEYSDMLLALLLKANRTAKYAERSRNENMTLDLSLLNEKQLELLASGASLPTILAAASASSAGAETTAAE